MGKALQLALAAPTGSIEAYQQVVQSFPLLSEEEERELAERYQRVEDLEAARLLVLSHLRFVVRLARSYSGYGLPQADLIQQGNIGLMKAVRRFDPAVGVRLVSFAVHWIRAEIHEYILRNWRIVKVATTKAQRKLFFNLRGAKKRLGWLNQEEVRDIADDLGVAPEAVMEMEKRLHAHDAAFDAPVDEEEAAPRAPASYLYDSATDPALAVEAAEWEDHSERQLTVALGALDERSRHIVERRWLSDDRSTLQELGDEFGVSAERIRQLEKNALRKLRAHVQA